MDEDEEVIVHVHYHVRKTPVATLVRKMNKDPEFQLRWHRVMSWFWIVNIALVTTMFFVLPHWWDRFAVFYLVIISVYANFSTDYGAVPAAETAVRAGKSLRAIGCTVTCIR